MPTRLFKIVAVSLDGSHRSLLDFGITLAEAREMCVVFRARGWVAYLPDDLDW